jgi:hypothetical protein
MLSVMRDVAADEPRQLEAAKSAAPYVHARLSAVEHSGDVGITFEQFLAGLR